MFVVFANFNIHWQQPTRFHGEVTEHGDHFLWKIADFDKRVFPRNPTFSPYFEFAGRIWGLQISCSGRRVRLILKNYCDCDDSHLVTLGLKIEEGFMLRDAEPDPTCRTFTALNVLTIKELFHEPSAQILPSGTLTVFCRITAREQNVVEDEEQHKLESIEKLQEDIGDLLYNHKFSDIRFLVQNVFIDAHKDILSARSPVLSKMVAGVSDKEDPIRIPDVEPRTFSDFLYYLYTGTFKKMNSKVAGRLHPLGERFQMPELKAECELFLKKKSTSEEPLIVDLASSSNQEVELFDSPKKAPSRKRKRKS